MMARKKRAKTNKRSITLVELLLALSLLVILFGSVGFGIKRAMKIEKFKAEAHRLSAKIELFRYVRAAYLADFDVTFMVESHGLRGHLSCFSSLPSEVVHLLSSDLFFAGIEKIELDGKAGYLSEMTLHFRREGDSLPGIALCSGCEKLKIMDATRLFSQKDIETLFPFEVLSP